MKFKQPYYLYICVLKVFEIVKKNLQKKSCSEKKTIKVDQQSNSNIIFNPQVVYKISIAREKKSTKKITKKFLTAKSRKKSILNNR